MDNMDTSGNSLPSGPDAVKRKVSYFYDPEIGNYYYGYRHEMKPLRIRMTHSLISSYNLLPHMQIHKPIPATYSDFCNFHADDYITFLKSVTPDTQHQHKDLLKFFHIDKDCPIFDGLYSYCQSYTGGSLGAASSLNTGDSDIAINWSGGLHHAKKWQACGFCYVNDIVLAILELLKVHDRVLYVDIDVHHGNGVEEAFYTTDRVMTVSFHKFGDYFPYTGDIRDIGFSKGKYYSLNAPLLDGIDDESYLYLFKPLMAKVMEVYKPGVIVLQCGADSLYGDRLGYFNLSVKGHGECVKFMRSFNVPLMLLGGGGYNLGNVGRCWCYETSVAIGVEVEDELPQNDSYIRYYGPDFKLNIQTSSMINENMRLRLDNIRIRLLENLSYIEHAPSVQFQERVPGVVIPKAEDDQEDPNARQDADAEYERKPLIGRVKQEITVKSDPDDREGRDGTINLGIRIKTEPQEEADKQGSSMGDNIHVKTEAEQECVKDGANYASDSNACSSNRGGY